jgi:hypothetical protein
VKNANETAFRALRPTALEALAAEKHAERRDADLAAAFASPEEPAPRRRRMPRALVAGAAALTAAAAVVAVVAVRPAADGHPRGTVTTSAPVRRMDARTVLLVSAENAAKAPATSGRYWYTDENTESYTDELLGKPRPPARRTVTKLPYGAFVSSGQETWIARDGHDRTRSITGIDVKTRFPTPADEAAWKKAGSPDLTDGLRQTVNNYDIPIRYTIGADQVTMDRLRKLPTGTAALEAELRRRWKADRAAGTDGDGFTGYLWTTAQDLLAGPITPGTKAALYRVLAGQPGIRYDGNVKDRLGRPGVALAMTASGKTGGTARLVIDTRTGRLLAYESWQSGRSFPDLSEVYRSMGWAGGLSDRP